MYVFHFIADFIVIPYETRKKPGFLPALSFYALNIFRFLR